MEELKRWLLNAIREEICIYNENTYNWSTLKEWIIKEINYINKEHHNESTYAWSKGFKKGLLEVLDMINKIEK
jgi:hypothetical protein